MSSIDAITYYDAAAISPNDTAPSPGVRYAALQATTGAGIANVVTAMGTTVQIYLPLGLIVPLLVTQVKNTSTTATGIVGFFAFPAAPPKGAGG